VHIGRGDIWADRLADLVRVVGMESVRTRSRSRIGTFAAVLIIAIAIALGGYALYRNARLPSTDDATIDADVVHVAATVGGRIISIPVVENQHVARGDLLFQIDPVPYRSAVAQAQAELDLAKAQLATQHRTISSQQSIATIADEEIRSATANLDLANRTVTRLRPLAASGYVPAEQLDRAETAQRDALTSLSQAKEHAASALQAVDTDQGGEAAVRARVAALAIAQRQLDDTTVRAAHAGYVVGLSASTGEIVAPSQTLFTLVNSEEWFAVGNFRETELSAIAPGDCATVYAMTDRTKPIAGVVQGIGAGVLDEERVNLPRSVPYEERELNWVRVEQRFPVRVQLKDPPQGLVRLGASAVVEVKHGAACR
jgi:membrane fusion protein, multidrug efflux system